MLRHQQRRRPKRSVGRGDISWAAAARRQPSSSGNVDHPDELPTTGATVSQTVDSFILTGEFIRNSAVRYERGVYIIAFNIQDTSVVATPQSIMVVARLTGVRVQPRWDLTPSFTP